MIRTTILAAATLLIAAPATAQVSQSELDATNDRAMAAGYKALFLCGAIANAERNGGTRDPDHVAQWELTGIQDPLDDMVREMPYEIVRSEGGIVHYVTADWSADLPPRVAVHAPGEGCSIHPIGFDPATLAPLEAAEQPRIRSILRHRQNVSDRDLVNRAFDGSYGADSRTTAIIVSSPQLPDGRFEFYADGFGPEVPQRTWSVAKSIAATIVGAAVHRGEADVVDGAGLGIDDTDPRRAITIDHGLRMATGRYSDTPGNRTDPLYFGGATVDERTVNWPLMHAPGTVFRYANNDTLIAIQAIEDTFASHPPAELFDLLRMRHTVAETDWQGNYILSSQVWATARDLVRLGQLHLNDGVLPNGTRVLPEGWVQYVSDPSGPQPDGAWGYGAGWWTMRGMEGIPDDAFAARGNRGQYIVVIPSEDLVIVRRGEDPAGGSGFDIAAFTRDVLVSLEN
ncbi:serine hydrolase [Aurantiacibacter sp. MUD11]|uniref:serine hydrolase domain-containing protein n=1 Tax=Aurantiacibacter sp. MUD11 TaxID=3003265 RepID=UPI0022AAF5A1|nr:serine hydrolase [Aurantiacibacter sp. MUD11]WAT17973.1 serine hydrolase [Aurantiacibacter sp. MUD11]